MICDFCQYFNKGRCFAQKDAPVMLPEYNIVHCDVYDRTFTNLTPVPGEDNIKKGGNNEMGYSKKAKAADANAEEKKISVGEIIVTRANEIKENVVMFDIQVRGITIYGMCMRHYTNKKGEEGDMISFPARPSDKKDDAGNVIYYNHCYFPISKELKDKLIDLVVAKLNSED